MELEINTEKIKNSILKIEKITGKNLTLPVLNSILLIASGKLLTLRATNLSIGIEMNIPANVKKEGRVAVFGSVLLSIFSNLSIKGSVLLKEEDGNLIVKTKESNIKLKCFNHEDFPTIPVVSENSFLLDINKLINGIKSVYYSAAVSDIKPEVSSVFIYTDDEDLIFVSTDQFRLAEKKIKAKLKEEIPGIIIPFKNVPEILRVFSELKSEVQICYDKNLISFSCNDGGDSIYLMSRVIDGTFPDYRQILPEDFNVEIRVLKDELLNALKLSNIFSDKFNQINLRIYTNESKNKILEISSNNSDIGENKTQVSASVVGGDLDLTLNYHYFLDCFQSISSDSVLLRTNIEEKQEVVKGEKDEKAKILKPIIISGVNDNSFIYLIMPIR